MALSSARQVRLAGEPRGPARATSRSGAPASWLEPGHGEEVIDQAQDPGPTPADARQNSARWRSTGVEIGRALE